MKAFLFEAYSYSGLESMSVKVGSMAGRQASSQAGRQANPQTLRHTDTPTLI